MITIHGKAFKADEVYKRAEISKQLFSKMLSNKYYQPTKNTGIQLAIGLQLDMNHTQKLLEKAGYTLTRRSKADLVVQYHIPRHLFPNQDRRCRIMQIHIPQNKIQTRFMCLLMPFQ